MGLHCIYRKPRTILRHSAHRGFTRTCYLTWLYRHASKPRRCISSRFQLAKGFVTLTCVMDIYSRKSLYRCTSNTSDACFCVEATSEAVRFYSPTESINTDRGSQYTYPVLLSQRWRHHAQSSVWMERRLGQTTFSSSDFGAY